MKFVFMPDSFKGTLSSAEVCQVLDKTVREVFPDCETISLPVADGGEGSVDCFLAAIEGEKIYITAKNPFFEDIPAFYGLIDGGKTAVIEMAACAGLPLIEDRKDPMRASTYGVGQLIAHAINQGVTKIVVGLGGSATTDGGCGAAAACGVRFYNGAGETFVPTGGTLSEIVRIDCTGADIPEGVEIVAMCDIDNPLYGPAGAAHVFGPQKGAGGRMIEILDTGLQHLASVIQRDLGKNISHIPGSGAAGGMGAGMMAFFGARLQMGIETVLDTVHFEQAACGADLIITGEGKLDSQSLHGKVVAGVGRRAKQLGIPVIAIVGGVDSAIEGIYDMGITAVFSINRLPEDFSVSRTKSRENLQATAKDVFRLIRTFIERM